MCCLQLSVLLMLAVRVASVRLSPILPPLPFLPLRLPSPSYPSASPPLPLRLRSLSGPWPTTADDITEVMAEAQKLAK